VSTKEGAVERVAIAGVGLMGLGIGVDFARFGYQVSLYDTKANFAEKALKQAGEDLDLMVEGRLITARKAKAAYQRLHPADNLETATADADYVVESIFDKLDLKQELFTRLDELCPPPVILATNTTTLRVTDIAANTKHPERILTTHYFQPPHFIPLVEVVGGEKTAPETIDRAAGILRGLDKKVVILDKDANGLIGACLQTALSQGIEAIMKEGLSHSFQDIDDIISFAFGRRLYYLANFKRLDFMGLDSLYAMFKESRKEIWEPIAQRVERGEYGMKTGKGFYDWPGDTAQQEQLRLKKGLIRMMKQDKEEGVI
jgi:3-hydroxybutyryl-CoA dehydrogenase